jgi:ferric-dicitrate binding protein FerR (iron transport regulator)
MAVHQLSDRRRPEMRKRTIKLVLAVVAVIAVLGVGVAVAATNQSSWSGGRGAQMTNADRTTRTGDRRHLRARDGTGPRHEQRAAGTGNRADCPYRS